MAIGCSVVKSIFSFMVVLVASLGWGVTRPHLGTGKTGKILGVSFCYIVMDFFREYNLISFRHSHSLPLSSVLLCLLPVALLNGAICYWIFTALANLLETLEDRRQNEKLALYVRLWRLLVFALSVASCSLLFQIFDSSRSISIRWQYQWFFTDGMTHILFWLVLAVMMYLWAPRADSQTYAYQQASRDDLDSVEVAEVLSEESGDDGVDEESVMPTAHEKPGDGVSPKNATAEKIGAGFLAD